MKENDVGFVSYSQRHKDIVIRGIVAISEYLDRSSNAEKRSLLFCLDRYLDPYYGYKLSFFDELILLLQKQLFEDHDKEIIDDVLQLLTDYSKDQLDYLAQRIDEVDSSYLADALYALGNTYNINYVPVFINYENHENPVVREIAQNTLKELSKI